MISLKDFLRNDLFVSFYVLILVRVILAPPSSNRGGAARTHVQFRRCARRSSQKEHLLERIKIFLRNSREGT